MDENTAKPRSLLGKSFKQFKKNKLAVAGLIMIILIMLLGLLAPVLALSDPIMPQLEHRLEPGFWVGNYTNLFGTDELGRDVLARVIYGTRISLKVGYIVIAITAVFGTLLGIISAYYGKLADLLLMRVTDIFLSFPPLLLVLAVVAVLGTGLEKAMLAISIIYVPQMARIVRGSVLTVKELPYIEASRALGAKDHTIIFGHILPNVLAPTVVYLTLLLADAILYTAALGFLGVGIDPSTPEWGPMLSSGRNYLLLGDWWVTLFPGLMIILSVLSFNLFGDCLLYTSDAADDLLCV